MMKMEEDGYCKCFLMYPHLHIPPLIDTFDILHPLHTLYIDKANAIVHVHLPLHLKCLLETLSLLPLWVTPPM